MQLLEVSPLGNCLEPNKDPDCATECTAGQFQNPFPDCSCTADFNPCPQANDPEEEYYACPAQGCPLYTVKVTDPDYVPGTSNCKPYDDPKLVQQAPFDFAKNLDKPFSDLKIYRLAYIQKDQIVATEPVVGMPDLFKGAREDFPHHIATNEPADLCPVNAPATIPPWGSTPDAFFLVANGPPNTIEVTQDGMDVPVVQSSPTNPDAVMQELLPGVSTRLEATFEGNFVPCHITFTVSGTPSEPIVTIDDAATTCNPQPPDLPPWRISVASASGNALSAPERGALAVSAGSTPADAIRAVMEDVEALVTEGKFHRRRARGPLKKLSKALKQLDKGKSACRQLVKFGRQVRNRVRKGHLTSEDGQGLIGHADQILQELECRRT